MARTSAEKMEELSGSLTFEVCKLLTEAQPTLTPSFDPSVYIAI